MPRLWRWRSRLKRAPRHRLDPSRIVETARQLADEIGGDLPGSTLASLAHELVGVAEAAIERGDQARRPILAIRTGSAVAVALVVVLLISIGLHIHARWAFGTISDVFEGLDAAVNLLLLLGGALWTCATFEARIKRSEALGFIEELREFIHVIDVTQLYFTPDLYHVRRHRERAAAEIDVTYLLYCTRMLAVLGNLPPLYTRGVAGDSILRAASEVEMLAIAVSGKHLSKLEALRLMGRDGPTPAATGGHATPGDRIPGPTAEG